MTLSNAEGALLRSQGGPLASAQFVSFPTNRASRLEPQLLRVLFLRRLRLPLPLSARACRCGRPLDVFGHHRSACAVVGTLGRRGFPLENAAARVCREAGGRSVTWILVWLTSSTKARGRGGRTTSRPRSATGTGYDVCVPLDQRRRSQASHSQNKWSLPRGRQTPEGGALPGVGWRWRQGSLGRARRGSGRSLLG